MPFKCLCGYTIEGGKAFSAHFKHNTGDAHRKLGWLNPETGELLPKKPRIRKPKQVSPKQDSSKQDSSKQDSSSSRKKSSALKGKISPIEVTLDPRMQFFYEWDRIMVPDYDGSLSDWLWECVWGFHIQNKERLKFDLLTRGL